MKYKICVSCRIPSVVQQQAFILFKHNSSNDTDWALSAPRLLEVRFIFTLIQSAATFFIKLCLQILPVLTLL